MRRRSTRRRHYRPNSHPLETETGALVFLTNTHVAAPPPDAELEDAWLQPGPHDGGDTDDRTGTLHDFAAISRDEPNTSDSALVEVASDNLRANEIIDVRGYYPNEPVTFTGVDAFTPMSSGGDSGSLIGLRDDGDGDGDSRRTLLDVILALLRRFFGKRSRSRRRDR